MTDLVPTRPDALAPLREALLAAAHADADRVTGDADDEARRIEDEAAERAAGLLAEARRRGEADGAERLAAARAAARRDARTVVLRAQRTAYDALRESAVEEVARRLTRPEEQARQRALVVDVLGPDAELVVGDDGDARGTAPDGRVLDTSAERLVDLALTDLDVDGLWAP